MSIVHVPHPTLRLQAQPDETVDENVVHYITELEKALLEQRNPRGVGLSFPQIDRPGRIFATYLSKLNDKGEETSPVFRTFINPVPVDTSKGKTFGPDMNQPILEGCLSIPHLYGPVPRFDWVEYEYQTIQDGELKTFTEKFYDFEARVMQHEYDHLEGILFTDYILEFDLPLYNDEAGKMKLVKNKTFLEKF